MERRRDPCAGRDRDADDGSIGRDERRIPAQLRLRAGAAASLADGRVEMAAVDSGRRRIARASGVDRAWWHASLPRARGRARRVPDERSDRPLPLRDVPAVRCAAHASLLAACDGHARRRVPEGRDRGDARGVASRCDGADRARAVAPRVAAGRHRRSRDPARRGFVRTGRDPLACGDRDARGDRGGAARLRACRPARLRGDRGGSVHARPGGPIGRTARRPRTRRSSRDPSHDVRRRRWKRLRARVRWRAGILRRRIEQPWKRRRARAAAVGRRARRTNRCGRRVAPRHRSLQRGRRPHPARACRFDLCP